MAVLTPWPHLTQCRGPQPCTSMSGALLVLLEPLFLHIWCVEPWVMSHITQCWHRCLQVIIPVPATLAQQQPLLHCGKGCRSGCLSLKSWKHQLYRLLVLCNLKGCWCALHNRDLFKVMRVCLWRGRYCVCFSNIQFPAHVKAATGDSCPDWGTLWYHWLGELLKPGLPSTVSTGWGQEKKKTSKQEWADMCTMVWKGPSENLQ